MVINHEYWPQLKWMMDLAVPDDGPSHNYSGKVVRPKNMQKRSKIQLYNII